MIRSLVAPAAVLLLAVASVPAIAQVPADAFARHPEVYSASLSPSGEYIALAVPAEDGMETRLQVVKLDVKS